MTAFVGLVKAVKSKYEQLEENTLVFIYYAGHGQSDNYSFAMLNEAKLFPLEQQVRVLARMKGSYVIALFDCCREKAKTGLGHGSSSSDQQEDFIITFGCPPTSTVPARSTIAHEYF